MFHVPEKFRVMSGLLGSIPAYGNNGAFYVRVGKRQFTVIASDGEGWEHVSVSLVDRCPNWREMCRIKDLFWDSEDVVMQLHPAGSEYVNVHPNCLHLWRPINDRIPVPPSGMVGPKA